MKLYAGEAVGIELIRIRIVVLLGGGIVDGEGVSFGGSANGNAYHGFILEGGAILVIFRVLVELGNGEEREPCAGVRGNVKWSGEFSVDLGRDLVGHSARVLNGVEPVVPGHLFLGHVCSSHGADCGPCTSSQSVGGLAHGGSINDLGLHAIDPVAGVTPQEFLVLVAAELLGERAGISAKVFEGLDDAFGHERLHAVEPNVLGDTVDEKDSVALTQLAYGVAKNYVQVELVKVMVGGSKGFAAVPLAEVGKLADRRAGFIPLDKLSIFRGTAEVFVVVEMAVSKQMLYLVGGEILEGVRPVWCVTWTHVGRRCGWVGGKKDNSVLDNPSGLRRGLGRRGCCGSCVGNDDFKFNGIGILPIFCSLSNCGEGRGWRHNY